MMELIGHSIFHGTESDEVKYIKNFEKSCATINQHISKDAKKMSVLEYLEVSEMLQKQFKEQAKKSKK